MQHPFSAPHTDADTLPSARPVISRAALDAAIDWMVLFRSGASNDADRQRFSDWKALDSEHACAWEKVAGILDGSFAPLHHVGQRTPGHARAAGQAILQATAARPSEPKRKFIRGLLSVGAISTIGACLVKNGTIATLAADLRTGTGERRTFDLPDGSTAVLNACTVADVDFTATARVVRLRQGELIVTARPDDGRPFVVLTDCGTASTLAGRFLVRQHDERSFTLALEQSVKVAASDTRQDARVLRAGDAVWFDRHAVGPIHAGQSGKAAWIDGMLSANDEPLGEVIAALRPYRHGWVSVSPAASRLRVLGAFPLDDTERVLQSLVQTLPIRMTRYSAWLVRIDTV